MRSKSIRLLWIAALLIFAAYLYCPIAALPTGGGSLFFVSGLAELGIEADGKTVKSRVEDVTAMLADMGLRGTLMIMWDEMICGVSLVLGAIALSQLPLLCSPHLPLRRWVRLAMAVLFFQCAVSVIAARFQTLTETERDQMCFGAWLPPIAFALAGTALLLRRKDAADAHRTVNTPSDPPPTTPPENPAPGGAGSPTR